MGKKKMQYVKPEYLSIKNHPELSEKWVQDRISEDPSLLGLGDVVLRDRERIQPRAGRLDLLLQDDGNRRYEVEIQLGATDESHIIRCIEYWDIERRRYPQYDHCAVIVAEQITSRFLNVISLFNGIIPIIAMQMRAIKVNDQIALIFTRVLDEMSLGLIDDDEDSKLVTDRAYWEKRGTKETVDLADKVLSLVKNHHPALELKYNKLYIGLAENGQPNNFITLRPLKSALVVRSKIPRSDEVDQLIENSGLDALDYDARRNRYRIRLTAQDLDKHNDTIAKLVQLAYEANNTD